MYVFGVSVFDVSVPVHLSDWIIHSFCSKFHVRSLCFLHVGSSFVTNAHTHTNTTIHFIIRIKFCNVHSATVVGSCFSLSFSLFLCLFLASIEFTFPSCYGFVCMYCLHNLYMHISVYAEVFIILNLCIISSVNTPAKLSNSPTHAHKHSTQPAIAHTHTTMLNETAN